MTISFNTTRAGYANLWSQMVVLSDKVAAAQAIAKKLATNKSRYQAIAEVIGCPWYFIAVLHQMESGANFGTYLGNGQSLSKVTTLVPAGRGPFETFEAGAIDALHLEGIDKITVWDTPRLLWQWESFNGLGYFGKTNSPYLWSYSNLYVRGKYAADGVYDASLVSTQCGAAVIFKEMIELGIVTEGDPAMDDLKTILSGLGRAAPTIAANVGGPLGGIVIGTVAKALGLTQDAAPQTIIDKIHAIDLPDLISLLGTADSLVQGIVGTPVPTKAVDAPANALPAPTVVLVPQAPAAAPAPAVVVTPSAGVPATGDPKTPGILKIFDGYNTYIGMAVCFVGYLLSIFVTQIPVSVDQGIIALGILWGGAGAVNMIKKIGAFLPQAQILVNAANSATVTTTTT